MASKKSMPRRRGPYNHPSNFFTNNNSADAEEDVVFDPSEYEYSETFSFNDDACFGPDCDNSDYEMISETNSANNSPRAVRHDSEEVTVSTRK